MILLCRKKMNFLSVYAGYIRVALNSSHSNEIICDDVSVSTPIETRWSLHSNWTTFQRNAREKDVATGFLESETLFDRRKVIQLKVPIYQLVNVFDGMNVYKVFILLKGLVNRKIRPAPSRGPLRNVQKEEREIAGSLRFNCGRYKKKPLSYRCIAASKVDGLRHAGCNDIWRK